MIDSQWISRHSIVFPRMIMSGSGRTSPYHSRVMGGPWDTSMVGLGILLWRALGLLLYNHHGIPLYNHHHSRVMGGPWDSSISSPERDRFTIPSKSWRSKQNISHV
uniref:ORF105 n=1 Tax=Pinus koraiensis TaxID=88728 RepID=Q85X46_PINKO|nr:ORF105 [Pinus koraiensis]AAO74017.2 ORF105 [Pinus koraiensis]